MSTVARAKAGTSAQQQTMPSIGHCADVVQVDEDDTCAFDAVLHLLRLGWHCPKLSFLGSILLSAFPVLLPITEKTQNVCFPLGH